jgi:hypothetical protein
LQPERRRQTVDLSQIEWIYISEKAGNFKDRITWADSITGRVEMQGAPATEWERVGWYDYPLTHVENLPRAKAIDPHQLTRVDIEAASQTNGELTPIQPIHFW